MTEGKASVGFLKTELHRLAADEEGRKKDYHWARAELQEIWDKLVSLRSHINKFQSDIENAKIEEIMRGAGSVMASNYSSASGETYLSLDSANRAASINKLKEKIRMKDVLKGRISMLEEKIVEGRKQLPRVTESLKLAGLQSQANLSTDLNISTVSTPGSSADASLSRTMALRQAILTISDKINTWENELLHARNDLKDLEVDLSGEISSITMGHPGAASSGADVADSSVLSRIGPTPSKLAQSNSHVSAQQSARKTQNLNSTPARDDSINDIIAHGPPLSSSLASALRTGACGSASAGITAAGADSSGWTMMQDCEFSVYEVITGQAAVVRLNGEAPALYVMRLQRRLGSLLTLELQMQLEFEGKVAQVKQYRDALREVEIKRLRVELQVSNVQNALQASTLSTQHMYQPTALSTPYASVSRSIAFVTAAGSAMSSSAQGGAAARDLAVVQHALASLQDPTLGTPSRLQEGGKGSSPHRGAGTESAEPARSPNRKNTRASSASPSRGTGTPDRSTGSQQHPSSAGRKHSPMPAEKQPHSATDAPRSRNRPPEIQVFSPEPVPSSSSRRHPSSETAKSISFEDSGKYATRILRDILRQQTALLSTETSGANGAHSHAPQESKASFFSPERSVETGSARKVFGRSPSTKEIHRLIMQFMLDHNLDPRTHYSGIIKAIKIQVLSQLLSRDLSDQEVHHTAMLMSVSSPPPTSSKKGGAGSQRLSRYFQGEHAPISPIPMPSEYRALADRGATAHPGDSGNLVDVRHSSDGLLPRGASSPSPRTPQSGVTFASTLSDSESDHEDDTADGNAAAEETTLGVPQLPAAPHAPSLQSNDSPQRFQFPNAQRDMVNSSRKKPWGSAEPAQAHKQLAAKALQSAVSALSETFKEEMLSVAEYGKGSSKKCTARSPGGQWRHHSSVRRNCSCASCRAASLQGESTDEYNYQTQYNRHGHRISSGRKSAAQDDASLSGSEGDVLDTISEDHEGVHDQAPPQKAKTTAKTTPSEAAAGRSGGPVTSTRPVRDQDSPHRQRHRKEVNHAEKTKVFDTSLLEATVFDISQAALDRSQLDSVLLAPSPVPETTPRKSLSCQPTATRRSLDSDSGSVKKKSAAVGSPSRSSIQNTNRASAERPRQPPAQTSSASSMQAPAIPAPTSIATRETRSHAPQQIRGEMSEHAGKTLLRAQSPVASAGEGLGTHSGRTSPIRSSYCEVCAAVSAMDFSVHAVQVARGVPCVNAACPAASAVTPGHGGQSSDLHIDTNLSDGNMPSQTAQHAPINLQAPQMQPAGRSALVPELGHSGSRNSSPLRGGLRDAPAVPYTHEHPVHAELRQTAPFSGYLRNTSPARPADAPVHAQQPLLRTETGRAVSGLALSTPSYTRAPPPPPVPLQYGVSQGLPAPQPPTDYVQLLQMLQRQQQEIDALRAGRSVPPATVPILPVVPVQQTSVVPATPNVPALPAPATYTGMTAVSAPFTPFANTAHPAHKSAHTAHSNSRPVPTHTSDESALPLSVAKPRLGGSGSARSAGNSGRSTPSNFTPATTVASHATTHSQGHIPIAASAHSAFTGGNNQIPASNLTLVVPPPAPSQETVTGGFGLRTPASHTMSTVTAESPSWPAPTSLGDLARWSPTPPMPVTDLPKPAPHHGRLHQSFFPAPAEAHPHPTTKQVADNHSVGADVKHQPAIPVREPQDVHIATHSADPTVQSILTCLHERVRRLTQRAQQAQGSERLHPQYGIALHSDGSSKAYIDVNVLCAKNLPEMKKLTRSSDVYIEIHLVTLLAETSIAALSAHQMAMDTSSLRCGQVYDRPGLLAVARGYRRGGMEDEPHSWDEFVDDMQRGVWMNSYCRTTVKPSSLFPEWREFFHLSGVTHPPSQALFLTVRDAASAGLQISQADTIVGCAVLPLSASILQDQHPHNVWLPLQPPPYTKHQAFTHRIREDCAVKVEVKLLVSEQRYWADLRDETQLILQKVSASLAPGAGAASALTAAEGRKLEKWLDAMHAGPAPAVAARMASADTGEHQSDVTRPLRESGASAAPAPVTAADWSPTSHRPTHSATESHFQTEDPTASTPPLLPLLPLSAPSSTHSSGNRVPAPAAGTTSPKAYSPTNSSQLYRTPSAAPRPVSRGNYPTASRSARQSEGAVQAGSGPRTVRKFVGLREESNRDLFLKSLRSETKPTAQPRQNTIPTRTEAAISPPRMKPRVPELPLRPMNAQVQSEASEGQQKLDQVRRLQAELAGMQDQNPGSQKHALLTPAQHAPKSRTPTTTTGVTARKASAPAPPPLPYTVQQQSSAGKVDLSIFKRAGSDPIYQREVRVDVGNKLQHRAEVTNEKLGFLSGGQRRLKF